MSDSIARVSLFAAEVLGTQDTARPRVSQVAIQVLRLPGYLHVMAGGLAPSSRTRIGLAATSDVGTPGVTMSGVAPANIGFTRTGGGGAVVLGLAEASRGVTYVTQGDIAVLGAAAERATYRTTMTGGPARGGTAFASGGNRLAYVMYNGEVYLGPNSYSSARGVLVAGQSITLTRLTIPTSGGAVTGGDAAYRAGYRSRMIPGIEPSLLGSISLSIPQVMGNSPGGDIVLQGGALSREKLYCTMTGPFVIGGGSTNNPTTRRLSMLPGNEPRLESAHLIRATWKYNVLLRYIRVAGEALVHFVYNGVPSGGIVVGGEVEAHVAYQYTSIGGAVVAGHPDVTIALDAEGNGQILMGGAIPLALIAGRVTMRGGIQMAGSAKGGVNLAYTSVGGPRLGSLTGLYATFIYLPRHPGNRIYVFGSATYGLDHYEYTMTGGPRIRSGSVLFFKVCVDRCDTRIPYYRMYEGNPGCAFRYKDPLTGASVRKNSQCARMIVVEPLDLNRRSGRSSAAYVSAVTVCQAQLFTRLRPEQTCSTKLPL